jgi:hypothetical protein
VFLVVKRVAEIGIIFGCFINVQCLISQISGIIIMEWLLHAASLHSVGYCTITTQRKASVITKLRLPLPWNPVVFPK